MLKRIYVDNFRSLVNFELHLGKVNLFMGGNGSGKSSVFTVLRLLQHVVRGRSLEGFGPSSCTRWQTRSTQTFEVDVELQGALYRYRLLIDHQVIDERPYVYIDLGTTIKEERLSCANEALYVRQGDSATFRDPGAREVPPVLLDAHRSGLDIVRGKADPRLRHFFDWLSNLLVVSLSPSEIKSWSAGEERRPTDNFSNFASWYRHLLQSKGPEMDEAREALRQVMGGFRSVRVADDGHSATGRTLITEWRLPDGEKITYTFDELSDGQRALIALYTLLHAGGDEALTIAVDEPDNFVALPEIQPWLGALSERPSLQALLISHHPEILNMHAHDAGIVFHRDNGGPTRVDRFTASPEETLTPAELIARGWYGGAS